jgi:hypothetical protein
MTYEQAQSWLRDGCIAKRTKWPDSTWLSRSKLDDASAVVRVRTQNPFELPGDYSIYSPTQEDLTADDWQMRSS